MAAAFDQDLIRFAREHEEADLTRLLLGQPPPGIDAKAAVEQIQSRRKARTKLPDWHRTAGIFFPPPLSVEQASSLATARYKAELLHGRHLVDLTGGMGVDVLALAARFRSATYVEADAHLCRVFAHNAPLLSEHPPTVVHADAESFVRDFTGTAAFFVDPARRDDARRRVFLFEDCRPDVLALLPRLRGKAQPLMIKASPMIDVSEAIRQLGAVREVHVVSVGGDCKEVLLLVDFAARDEPTICCVNLDERSGGQRFDFTFGEERAAAPPLADPGRYLYDPNTSIRKAGAFKSVALRYGLARLAPSTHLYTSDELIRDFPGRTFEIEAEAGKRTRRELPEGRASVISRNHPLSADRLRQRLRLKDGGAHWVIGFRDGRGRARAVIARRV